MYRFTKLLIVAVSLTVAWPGWAVDATIKVGQGKNYGQVPTKGIPATPEQIEKIKSANQLLDAKYEELVKKDKELDLKITQIREAKITDEWRLCAARESLREDIAAFDSGTTNDAMKSLKTRSRALELLAEMDLEIKKNRYCLKDNP